MRSIKTSKKSRLPYIKESSKEKIYATVDGVLEPIIFDFTEPQGNTLKRNVFLTPKDRLLRKSNGGRTPDISTVQEIVSVTTTTANLGTVTTETVVSVSPEFVFNYTNGIVEVTSGNNVKTWLTSFGSNTLTMSTTANQPSIGIDGGGVNGTHPIYFKTENTDHLTLSSSVTLSGDFTVFMYINSTPKIPNGHKYVRLMGKSDDNDMYFSIGESSDKSYVLSFSSGSSVECDDTDYWTPTTGSSKILITLQRSGTKLYIRENGKQAIEKTTPTTDFTFNQFGKRGNITTDSFNGSLYHFSAYNSYLQTNLEELEQSIIAKASLSKEISSYDIPE